MDAKTGPFDLSKTPIHLGSVVSPDNPVVPLPEFKFDAASYESYISQHCAPGAPGRLLLVETTPANWSAWECHPEGDEIVIVLEGKGVFIQEIGEDTRRIPIGPGSTIINPAGVWHTADVELPVKAIYLTPGPGTLHRAR
jgi:quercetin dioxygenase-like cupin family protein